MANTNHIRYSRTRNDLTGQKFGRLTVLAWEGKTARRMPMWKCLCECGVIAVVNGYGLLRGTTRSCGCLVCDATRKRSTIHGCRLTSEYDSWSHIVDRCENPTNPRYDDYGGRGITICNRWRSSAAAFIADMGNRKDDRATIDRIDNNGGYWCGHCEECVRLGHPANCRWATRTQQVRNRRKTIMVNYKGRTIALAEACELSGISYSKAKQRIRKCGWTDEEALTLLSIPYSIKQYRKANENATRAAGFGL